MGGMNGDYRGYEAIKALAAELGKVHGKRGRPKPIAELLAMSPNRDPFYAGKPAQRDRGEWFAALWQRFGYTTGVHLRRVHYRLVSVEPGQPTRQRHDGEERYDEGAVELHALEALYPGELARLVREAIEPYRDLTLEERLNEAEEEAREQAEEAWNERMAPRREELAAIEQEARQIAARYEDALRRLNDRLQVELAPLHERKEAVRQAVQEEMALFQVTLPERPEPETDPVDEGDWLFASNRTYLAQLAMYKARKNGQA
jgi:hypothetical protein